MSTSSYKLIASPHQKGNGMFAVSLVSICIRRGSKSLRPNNDASQTSHCNIKGLSDSEVMRIENMITQVQFY